LSREMLHGLDFFLPFFTKRRRHCT
jgi:hypothetical protein